MVNYQNQAKSSRQRATPPSFYIARIGYGIVAKIHEQKMQYLGCKTLGYIESNNNKQKKAENEGYQVFSSCKILAETLDQNLELIWDICVDTKNHIEVLREILEIDPHPRVLIEKPVCSYKKIDDFKDLINKYPKASLVVNENYASSSVVERIKKILKEGFRENQPLTPKKIVCEMTKNRCLEMLTDARFIDVEHGCFGYELSHMITVVNDISGEKLKFQKAELSDLVFQHNGREVCWSQQGTGEIWARTKSKGIDYQFYTSMMGKIGYPYLLPSNLLPRQKNPYNILYGDRSKHRLVAVECEEGVTVLGLFEPIAGWDRGYGAVFVLENSSLKRGQLLQGKVLFCQTCIGDDTMLNHFEKALKYFQGEASNPFSTEKGIETVRYLEKAMYLAEKK